MRFRYRSTAAGILLLAAGACTSCSSQTPSSDTQVSSPATVVTATVAPSRAQAPSTPTSTAPPTPAGSTSAQPLPTATAGDATAAATIAGTWAGTYQSNSNPAFNGTFTVTFTQDGNAIAGTITVSTQCVDEGTLTGELSGDTITFGAVKAAETVAFDGTIDAGAMGGHYQSGPSCGDDTGSWAATRE